MFAYDEMRADTVLFDVAEVPFNVTTYGAYQNKNRCNLQFNLLMGPTCKTHFVSKSGLIGLTFIRILFIRLFKHMSLI